MIHIYNAIVTYSLVLHLPCSAEYQQVEVDLSRSSLEKYAIKIDPNVPGQQLPGQKVHLMRRAESLFSGGEQEEKQQQRQHDLQQQQEQFTDLQRHKEENPHKHNRNPQHHQHASIFPDAAAALEVEQQQQRQQQHQQQQAQTAETTTAIASREREAMLKALEDYTRMVAVGNSGEGSVGSYRHSSDDNESFNQLIPSEAESELLIVIPGYGNSTREPYLLQSIRWIAAQKEKGARLRCLLYVYATEGSLKLDPSKFSPCEIIRHPGLWMSHVQAVPDPLLKGRGQVLFWLADSVLLQPNVDLQKMQDLMEGNCLDALSLSEDPSTQNVHHIYDSMSQDLRNAPGRQVDFIEYQVMLMTGAAFQCMRSMVDLQVNKFGWGMDWVFGQYCNLKMGISDTMTFVKPVGGSYDYNTARLEMKLYLAKPEYKHLWRQKWDKTSLGALREHVPAKMRPYECQIPRAKRVSCWFASTGHIDSMFYDGVNITSRIYGDLPNLAAMKNFYVEESQQALLAFTIKSDADSYFQSQGIGFMMTCSNGFSTSSRGWSVVDLSDTVGGALLQDSDYRKGVGSRWRRPCQVSGYSANQLAQLTTFQHARPLWTASTSDSKSLALRAKLTLSGQQPLAETLEVCPESDPNLLHKVLNSVRKIFSLWERWHSHGNF
eukprot:TRINITY_DN9864_c0_g2_i1.p1 TRINITY_DN9864_c0_g2~~TRINITY_DN9864_c0_g2_i1.p1  ORF type:complete len:661 (+),score=111.48 TRINITY_DN9864_c0_g2_i1:51-2033(+)